MKKSAILALVLGFAAVLAFVDTSRTQELRRSGPGMSPGRGSGVNLPAEAQEASKGDSIRAIVGQLGEAPDAEKSALMKKLEAAVSKQFDRDMEHRESELTNLEERFKKLRQQLDRRRRAKNEIIELQIKVLVNEAEGLGFGGDSSASESWYQYQKHSNAFPSGPLGALPPPGGLDAPSP